MAAADVIKKNPKFADWAPPAGTGSHAAPVSS
jgi:hypothetical protein